MREGCSLFPPQALQCLFLGLTVSIHVLSYLSLFRMKVEPECNPEPDGRVFTDQVLGESGRVNNLTCHGFTVSVIIYVLSTNIEASKRWRAARQTWTSPHDAFHTHESAVSLVLLGQMELRAGLSWDSFPRTHRFKH